MRVSVGGRVGVWASRSVHCVADDAQCEDHDGESVAAVERVAAEELGYDFVVVLWIPTDQSPTARERQHGEGLVQRNAERHRCGTHLPCRAAILQQHRVSVQVQDQCLNYSYFQKIGLNAIEAADTAIQPCSQLWAIRRRAIQALHHKLGWRKSIKPAMFKVRGKLNGRVPRACCYC